MSIQPKLQSHLNVTGFTLNPMKSNEEIKNLLIGIGSYPPIHICDADGSVEHNNYIGTITLESIFSYYQKDKSNTGIFASACYSNGYATIKFWDEYLPARFEFNMYVNGFMKDADLVLDHLKAPARPADGIGAIDYQFSLTTKEVPFNILVKKDPSFADIKLGTEFELNIETREITGDPNTLTEITCYSCTEPATYWGITKTPVPIKGRLDMYKLEEDLINFKLVPTCIKCRDYFNRE
jgi:hypothetical protein